MSCDFCQCDNDVACNACPCHIRTEQKEALFKLAEILYDEAVKSKNTKLSQINELVKDQEEIRILKNGSAQK